MEVEFLPEEDLEDPELLEAIAEERALFHGATDMIKPKSQINVRDAV